MESMIRKAAIFAIQSKERCVMFFKKEAYVVSDVGGTKTVFALVDLNGSILFEKTHLNSEIRHYTDTLLHFIQLNECKDYKIKKACIAIAGPINTDRTQAHLTNYEWLIDSQNILVRTPIHHVTLINDFEAIGLGINTLKEGDYIELTNFGRNITGAISIIGPGTGLGVSILPHEHGSRIPMQSEGGHVDLPLDVNSKIDIKFKEFLTKKKLYKDVEDVVSGHGLVNIYDFLLTQKVKHNKTISHTISKLPDTEKPAFIAKYALEDKDVLCIRTLELFIKYYARVSRNLVLTTMCTELILAGGISPKIISALQDVFVEEMIRHDRENMRKILERTTVLVITTPDISLKGCYNALKI